MTKNLKILIFVVFFTGAARTSLAEVQNVKVSGDVNASAVYCNLSDSSLGWIGGGGLNWTNLAERSKTATPVVFKITVERFRISSDDGTTWTTVNDGDMELDIASVSTNSAVANYSAGNVAPGSYNSIEYMISSTCRMQGYIIDAVGATDYYTSTTEGNGTNSTTDFDVDNPPSDYGEAVITVHGCTEGDSFSVTYTADIVLKKGASRKLNIDFDLTDSLELYNESGSYRLRPMAPAVTVSLG